MRRFNLFTDEWDDESDRPGYCRRSAKVGEKIGASRIGAGVYELEPGSKSFPYHLHHANEEWLVVLRGRPTVRTPEGERELREGDTVCFPRGADGAHQIANRSAEPARVLLISTKIAPDVAEYPDSGKVGVWGTGLRYLLRSDAGAEYWEGE